MKVYIYIYVYIFDSTLITFEIKYHRMKDIGKNVELTHVYPKILKPKLINVTIKYYI